MLWKTWAPRLVELPIAGPGRLSGMVAEARVKVARVLGVGNPDRVVFTKNATESINVVLKGWLRPGDRVVISGMEHNSVVRPLKRLRQSRALLSKPIRCTSTGANRPR